MSRNSQGVLARKLEKSPAVPGPALPLLDDRLARRLRRVRPLSPRSSTIDLEPAGGPQSVDRRGAEDVDQPVGDLLAGSRSASGAAIASPERPGRGALVEVVEHHVHRAEVRRVGAEQDRLPGDGHRVRHARRLARRSARCAA